MYLAVYAEINLLSILILCMIYHKTRTNIDQQAANLSFERLTVELIAILIMDVAWTFVEGRSGALMRTANWTIDVLYMILCGLISFSWLDFTEQRLGRENWMRRNLSWLLLPVIALSAAALLAPWNHLLFVINADNHYVRGPAYLLYPCTSYFFLVISLLHALQELKNTRNTLKKKELRTLLSFYLLPILGGILSQMFYGLPLLWTFSTLSMAWVFVNYQEYAISTDGLTGLNNRRMLDYQLQQMLAGENSSDVFLMMMDIDGFKEINDRRGHVAGDKALIETAVLLKNCMVAKTLILARYGGDEFAVAGIAADPQEIAALKEQIEQAFDAYRAGGENSYPIRLSIGWAQAGRSGRTHGNRADHQGRPGSVSGEDAASRLPQLKHFCRFGNRTLFRMRISDIMNSTGFQDTTREEPGGPL
jgi:diguanylate cyclase (GGDEF)-like protein